MKPTQQVGFRLPSVLSLLAVSVGSAGGGVSTLVVASCSSYYTMKFCSRKLKQEMHTLQ